MTKKELYEEAFALLRRAQELLLLVRARHEEAVKAGQL